MLAISGLFFFAGCSDDSSNEPNPDPVETIPQCYLKSSNEISQGSDYLLTYTYDASNNITSVSEDGFTYDLKYTDGKVTEITSEDGDLITIEYENGIIPSKINYLFEGETAYSRFEISNNHITKDEYYLVEDGEAVLTYVSSIQYKTDGTLNSITEQEYDADTDKYTTISTVKNIVSDDKINPYTTSNALIIISLLDDDFDRLGKGNILSAEYDYMINSASNIVNSYTYNNEGYPLSKNQKGFSDEADFTFTYDCK